MGLIRRSAAEGPAAMMVDAHTEGAVGHVGVAPAFGFAVPAMVYSLGRISGAHVNPAVTIAIGLTVGFAALMGGPLTGASMNPARSLGPAIVGGIWVSHWIYRVAPVAAMLTAVQVHGFLLPPGTHDRSSLPVPPERIDQPLAAATFLPAVTLMRADPARVRRTPPPSAG